MKKLLALLQRSRHSAFSRRILNFALHRAIPFNAPHKLKIERVYENGVRILLPYKRVNQNHLKGIHACALATLAEYCSGISLMQALNSTDYRLIMKDLSAEYHYRAEMDVYAECRIGSEPGETVLLEKLKHESSIMFPSIIRVNDISGNHVCTVRVNWQIKKWQAVSSKA